VNTLARARRAQQRILRTQRRLWLLQVALWPTVVLAGIGAAAAIAMRLRDRPAPVAAPIDGLPHL
jgi:hypothetical protein